MGDGSEIFLTRRDSMRVLLDSIRFYWALWALFDFTMNSVFLLGDGSDSFPTRRDSMRVLLDSARSYCGL